LDYSPQCFWVKLVIKEESRVISDGREGVKILLVSSSLLRIW